VTTDRKRVWSALQQRFVNIVMVSIERPSHLSVLKAKIDWAA